MLEHRVALNRAQLCCSFPADAVKCTPAVERLTAAASEQPAVHREISPKPGSNSLCQVIDQMQPIKYQVVGEEDYAFVITIDDGGEYSISSGTYTSDPPRHGKLTTEQERAIMAAIHALGIPEEHPMPEGAADAFKARLVIGKDDNAVVYPFWEGALEEDSKLLRLVRLLEVL